MGFMDALSAGLTAGTQGAAGYMQGQERGRAENEKNTMAMLQLLRQKRLDEQNALLQGLQGQNIRSEIKARENPKPWAPPATANPGQGIWNPETQQYDVPVAAAERAPLPNTPGWEKAERFKASLAPPPASFSFGTGIDPSTNTPFVTRQNTRTGAVETTDVGKPAAAGVGSAINRAANARLSAAVSEMNNAHAGLGEYEAALVSGKANISGLSQFLSATANSFTHDDPASRAIQSTALAVLNRKNPDLGRYIRRGLSFAEGESMITQRPSDFRTKMAAFLSMAATNASPEMVADIQSRRNSIMGPLNETVKPTSATVRKPMSKAAYDKARAAGYTDAEIQEQGYQRP
jgi:hypothetical protein